MFNIQYENKVLDKTINRVIAREKLNKKDLADLSRMLIPYVYDTNDVSKVNRLIAGLTPMNKATAIEYFRAFLGWKFKEEIDSFTTQSKGKSYNNKKEAAELYLEDTEHNLWTWAADNLEVRVRPKNYANKITTLITKAVDDDSEEGLSLAEVVDAVLASGKLDLADLLRPLREVEADNNKEVA